MRVRRLEGLFKPVEIILDTKEELGAFRMLLGFFDGSEVPRQVEEFLNGLNLEIRNSE